MSEQTIPHRSSIRRVENRLERDHFRAEVIARAITSLDLTHVCTEYGFTIIGADAFADCPLLTTVVIPPIVEIIETRAFADCVMLHTVDIPLVGGALRAIEADAFVGCISLPFVIVPAAVDVPDGVRYMFHGADHDADRQLIIPTKTNAAIDTGVDYLTRHIASQYGWSHDTIELEFVDDHELSAPVFVVSLTTIASQFATYLTDVSIGISDTGAIQRALRRFVIERQIKELDLTDIYRMYEITEIEPRAFHMCTSLRTIIVPEGIVAIGDNAFMGCLRVRDLVVADSVVAIGDDACRSCESIRYFDIPSGCQRIGSYAFAHCNALTTLRYNRNVVLRYVGPYAFAECPALRSLDLQGAPNNAPYTIRIPSGVDELRNGTFSGCTAIESVVIPGSVITVGSYAFADCTALRSVVVLDGVEYIDDHAFSGCARLREIVMNGHVEFTENAFDYEYNQIEDV
jgi:hypothetical protein